MRQSAETYGGVVESLVAGEWKHPRSGEITRVPVDDIVIARSLDGLEADLVAPLLGGRKLVVVCDEHTVEVLGRRVVKALKPLGSIEEYVWRDPRPEVGAIDELRHATRHAEALIAVGSGTITDSCKYAAYLDGKDYCCFATSPMNAYTAPAASISKDGFKGSITAKSARGAFFDLEVLSSCPSGLVSAAYADVICRTTAQVDWLMSHMLLDTQYIDTPYLLLAYDESDLIDHAGSLPAGDIKALALLTRVCVLMGLATAFTGTSHCGSMAEHMISHGIDMFAGEGHPGSSHGEQVGVTTLTMSELQNRILCADSPPVLQATRVPHDELAARYGAEMADTMAEQSASKALDQATADQINERWARDWPAFVEPLREVMLPFSRLLDGMSAAQAPRTAAELGLDPAFYREMVRDARFTRDRFTMLDVAGDSDQLDDFVSTIEAPALAEGHRA